jgi:hypothetical protein
MHSPRSLRWACTVLACALGSGCAQHLPAPVLPPASASARACVDAYCAACGPVGEADARRLARARAAERAIQREALAQVAQREPFTPVTSEGWRAHLEACDPEERARLRAVFEKVETALALAHTAPLRARAESIFERLRARALARADRLDLGAEGARALERLRHASLRWPSASGTQDRGMRRGCGDDLLLDDAWVDKRAEEVALCPGLLLASRDEGEPLEALDDRLTFIVAHELGHVLLGPIAETRETERRADLLATALLAAELDARPPEARGPLAARALEPLCYPQPDPTHGSGRARIDDVVARHPAVADALWSDAPWSDAPRSDAPRSDAPWSSGSAPSG